MELATYEERAPGFVNEYKFQKDSIYVKYKYFIIV